MSMEWMCQWSECVSGVNVSMEWMCQWSECVSGVIVSVEPRRRSDVASEASRAKVPQSGVVGGVNR